MTKKWFEVASAAILLGAAASSGVVWAQTSLVDEYRSAKSSGLVGEQMDGYIEAVSTPSASIEALVSAINIKRKDVYFKVAQQTGARPDEAAFTGGCTNIKNTKPGEYYQSANGGWAKRTAEAPALNSKCPQ
jgi:uncharacterized protein